MLKRNLATGMAIMLSAESLFGCGSSENNRGDTSVADIPAVTGNVADASGDMVLRFSWWGDQVRNEKTDKVLRMYLEGNPGISFQEEINEFSSYWDRLAARSAGNGLPDIMQMDYRYIDQYVSNGLLLDLTPYVENGLLDLSNLADSVVDSGKIGGKLYGICNGLNAPTMIYNKTIIDNAGIEIGDEIALDHYIEYSKLIYEKVGTSTNIAYGADTKYLQYYTRDRGEKLYNN